jgi:7tm Odorant receptor
MHREKISKYAEIVIFFSYNFKAWIQYLTVNINLRQMGKLLCEASSLLEAKYTSLAEHNQRYLRRIIFVYLLINVSNVVGTALILVLTDDEFVTHHRYFFDDSQTPIRQILLTVSLASGIVSTAVNLMMQSCYYSLCIHTVTLYQQLHRQILELVYRKESERQAIIKKSIDMHAQIVSLIKNIKKQFFFILIWDFVVYITVMGMILYNMHSTVAFLRMILYLPAALYGSWVFCHGSSLITFEGRQMAVRLYTNVKWYEYDLKDQKSILIMMAQFQAKL